MLGRFKDYLTRLEDKIDQIIKSLEVKDRHTNDLIKELRHKFASIDLEDLRKKPLTEQERKSYLSRVAIFYPKVMENDLDELVYQQDKFIGEMANGSEQLWFGRGTINGILLIKEKYETLFKEYQLMIDQEQNKDKKKPDGISIFTEV